MQKIIIIGCPGAGKSTFARELKSKTGLPLYYLDMLWHKADKTTVSREEFDQKLADILKQDKWIIDGNYNRTLEVRFKACDTVFFLDFPLEVCLSGVQSRIGKKREDMPWVEDEFDPEFKEWIINFNANCLPKIKTMIDKYKDKNIVIFKSREDCDKYLERVK